VRQVYELGIVLLQRLRSDSSLVTHWTESLQDTWKRNQEIAGYHFLPMFLGETQQSQETERTDACHCSQNSGHATVLQPAFLVWVCDDLTGLVSL